MPTDSASKGRSLETAVKFFQQSVLESDPKLRGIKFSVESNRIITVAGVRHEIDVLIKALSDSAYTATWVFECKNWQKPVDKNEVIILAEKVEALTATRGFLVAKDLTKDAEAQLKLKPRLQYIRCTEDFWTPLSFNLIHFGMEILAPSVSVTWRGGSSASNPTTLDLATMTCLLYGTPLNFSNYIEAESRKLLEEERRKQRSRTSNPGTHWLQNGLLIEFAPSELTINGFDVESIGIPFHAFVTTNPRKLISKFEFEEQGQFLEFEPIERDAGEEPIEIQIITRFNQKARQ